MNCAVFHFGANEVRVFEGEGGLWFAASDAGDALGIVNVRESIARFPADEVGVSTADTNRGPREVTTLSEPGLYRLIFQSRKPSAERFKKWVFSEVLPALRKAGTYTVPTAELVSAPNPLVERTAAFLCLAEGLVKLGFSRNAAGARALRWMPGILGDAPAETVVPDDEAEAQEVRRLLAVMAEGLMDGRVEEVALSALQQLAVDLEILPWCHEATRSAMTRLGGLIQRHGAGIIDANSGRWQVRRRDAARQSTWVFRPVAGT
jgi:hypothetical protein